MSTSSRVVITGMGWITPLGHDLNTVWSNLTKGVSGVRPIERFDAKTFSTNFAAQVQDYDFSKYVTDAKRHEHAGTHTRFALGAARQAWSHAKLDEASLDMRRVGTYLGAGEGVLDFNNYAFANLTAWNEEKNAIDGKVWANVWMTPFIVVVDSATGNVTSVIDCQALVADAAESDPDVDVLNGIAWDATNRELYLTGKLWPWIYKVTLDKKRSP